MIVMCGWSRLHVSGAVYESLALALALCILCRLFQPGCEYTVQLKSGDVNVHIERSMPRVRHIQVAL